MSRFKFMLFLGLSCVLNTLAFAEFKRPQIDERFRIKPNATRQCKVVLSFDDGPVKGNTPRLIKFLTAMKIPGTLFMVGSKVKENPEIVASTIGNPYIMVAHHSQTHKAYTSLTNTELTKQQIRPMCQYITTDHGVPYILNGKTVDQLNVKEDFSIGQQGYAYFAQKVLEQDGFLCGRHPGGTGHNNERVNSCLAENGINPQCVYWTEDIQDWKHWRKGKDYIASQIVEKIVSGCKKENEVVFVLHDLHKTTVDAVTELMLPKLIQEFAPGGGLHDEDIGVGFSYVDELSPRNRALRFANESQVELFSQHKDENVNLETGIKTSEIP